MTASLPVKMEDAVKSELLEAFPFSKYELDRLLDLYSVYSKLENGNFTTLSKWLEETPRDAYTIDDEENFHLLGRVEEEILPPNLVSIILKEALSTVFVLGCTNDDENSSSLQDTKTFLEAMATLLGRRGQQSTIHLLSSAAKDDALSWVYRLAIASHVLLTEEFSDKLDPSTLETPSSWKLAPMESFIHWATMIAPGASSALITFFHVAIFSRYHAFRPDIPPLLLPDTDQHPSALWQYPWDDPSLSLALLSPTLSGEWKRLFSNDADGNSFRTMQEALLSFQGPTVITIRSTDGDVFGFSTDCPWKSSRKWFGQGSDSFLFTLSPTLAFYPATGEGTRNMYLQVRMFVPMLLPGGRCRSTLECSLYIILCII